MRWGDDVISDAVPALVFGREGHKGGGVQVVRELDGWGEVSP
jgi:hypothetical protein